ncbi:MAG TPA: glutamate mutase L [Candidatus Sabulitectum sp.]|nr:glutamate mutase L [Candidatus Sabulitectum sp.]HPJ27749.1 glutamate mutase L [Candidatus Sabulitectum sp.]HPR21707.1 glutamate mutase L [Candidatus Sabulitectum sp.]
MTGRILAGDVGSTTTKLLLLERGEGGFRALGSRETGTTVEKPEEDVCKGFFKGLRALEEATGEKLTTDSGDLAVPFHTTSSAGGGLQILVVALASGDSGKMAQATAFSAGGVVLDSFAIDDETPRVEKIRRMQHLSPDLVIMAGGYEDGAIAGVVNMAQLVALSRPQPKYGKGKLPLVFCGNTKARPFIQGLLGEQFDITFSENIRPTGTKFNLRPAIGEVHRLFMDHVMQMAPGYPRLSEMTSAPIMPTPAGVERILRLVSEHSGKKVVMADMGGATTDIFSSLEGQFQRTVAANTGMSYSLSNIVREAGPDMILRHIPEVDKSTARNWILSKTLFPTENPRCGTAEVVEGAAAAEGMALAWKHHLEMGYRRSQVGFSEKLRNLGKCRFDLAFDTVHGDSFRISDIDVIIGAGGIMAHSSPRRAAWILAMGFRPKGLTTLMIDRHFHSPHMGVLSREFPEEALDYYERECLATVCRVYSPVRKKRSLQVTTSDRTIKVKSGGFLYLESSQGVSIPGVELPQDDSPLLVDMRFGNEVLPMDLKTERALPREEVILPAGPSPMPENDTVEKELSLAYQGDILVKESDSVEAGDPVGENSLAPPSVYFVDVRDRVGYQRKGVTDGMVMEGITVKPGDSVSTGQKILSMKTGSGLLAVNIKVNSPVRGEVTSVTPPGMVIMKEIQDYDAKPHFVNVARLLGVKPNRIKAIMKVRQGEFVHIGQHLAVGSGLKAVKSPATGTVMEIDGKTGVVKIQYLLNPVMMLSPVSGRVTAVKKNISATISCTGAKVQGIAGFGRTSWGALATGDPQKGAVMLLKGPLTSSYASRAAEAGVSGVVAPSMSAVDLVEFLDDEPGVILTGDEELPFSLILLRGVGDAALEDEAFYALESYTGGNCALFTTTRLRAGVERPFILLQDPEE